ncbi:hypothetical protein R9C00_24140 [Flammeovirgaceae bacterium SG7u.111]|nr:hypothetical protein [Flammeovirgaceae bacterium SG7u.132]WPO34792.1 hypothetical protein R9C00_24140 [Flammeovirgaceae bacterium SG7u.111]
MQNRKVNLRTLTEEQLQEYIKANVGIYDEYFDKDFLKELYKHVMDLILRVYFRPEFIGFDTFPKRNRVDCPLIFASNHSGMAFPWDGIVMAAAFFHIAGYGENACRPLTSPMLSQTALMNPFLTKNLWKRVGSIDATTLNFETMMQQTDYNLLIYPEGVPGIGKGFDKKYQLQRFSTSSLRMSLKYKTDIIPVATVNGEYINPLHYSNAFINKLINKIGIPFLPLGYLTIILLLQPWLFYFAMPAKLIYVRGKRIKPYKMLQKPFEEVTREDLEMLRDKVQSIMQAQLDTAVKEYGQKHYKLRELVKKAWVNLQYFPYYLPFGWPLLFSDFMRQYKKNGAGKVKMKLGFLSVFRIFLQNPFLLTYFIPVVGWIPMLIKGYRGK